MPVPPESDGGDRWIPEKMNPLLVVGGIPNGERIGQLERGGLL